MGASQGKEHGVSFVPAVTKSFYCLVNSMREEVGVMVTEEDGDLGFS